MLWPDSKTTQAEFNVQAEYPVVTESAVDDMGGRSRVDHQERLSAPLPAKLLLSVIQGTLEYSTRPDLGQDF
jgi:hypothetical protein